MSDEKKSADKLSEYGLIGEKLTHSYSVEIHKAFAKYSYSLCELAPSELDSFMKKADFRGINVTIPYKKDVIPYLSEVDKKAIDIGAVNTVVKRDGKLYGYNTDYCGMLALLEKTGVSANGKNCMILGTGGTSNTARAVLSDEKAAKITVVSRNPSNGTVSYEAALEMHDTEIIINTTPCGMYPKPNACPIDISAFPKLCCVIDAIYNPLRTKLILAARERGIPAEGGLYMLAAQGFAASELFFGKEPYVNDEKIQAACESIRSQKENTVLIGMPSCGKTTIGKEISRILGGEFFDSDEEFFKKHGITAGEYIKQNGEAAFRDAESEILSEISNVSGAVIATGGGAVLRKENIDILRRNGRLYFLDRSPEKLLCGGDRPLSANRDAVNALYEKRYPLYTKYCDRHIMCDKTVDETAREICFDMTNKQAKGDSTVS